MDAMDLDPPEPQRPLMQPQPQQQLQQQQQQHAQHQPLTSQSSCPGVRLDPYAQSHNSTAGRYDPVHGAADNAWGSHQWQPGPPATGGYYMHQRSQSGSDTFTSSFPGSTLGQQPNPPPIAPPEPYAYQLPFGYQTSMANQAIAGGPQPSHGATPDPYFGPVPYGMPMLHSGGIPSRLAPIHPAFRNMDRMSMSLGPMHGQPFGSTPQQSPSYGTSHTNNLRPQPPTQQRSSRSSHSTSSANPSATWLQTHRANAAAPPPPPPSNLLSVAANNSSNNPQQQQHRTSHSSSRRYRPASYRPTSSMVSSGDMSTSPPRSARGGPGSPFLERDDDSVRDAQFARGAMITTSVASLSAIKSLQKLEISSLPEGERTCNICYTDFGVKTPEGITELPVKIPVCQHVFGSNCIRTWFKDADHCPYCRAKVQSEHKHTFPPGSAHASAVLSQQLSLMMRSRAGHAMTHNPTLVSELLQQGILPEHLATPPPFHADRRPPPTNSEDAHRRQRARHGSYNTSQMRSQPSSLRQEQSMHQMQYHLAGEQSRTRTPPSGAQPANHDDAGAGDAAPTQQPAPGSPVTDRPDSQRLPRNSGVPQLSAMMSQHDLPSWQPPWIPTSSGTGPAAANALGGNNPAPRLAPGVSP